MNCHQKSNWIWRGEYNHITLAKNRNKKIHLHQSSTKRVDFLAVFRLPSVVLRRTRLTFQTAYNETTRALRNETYNANIAQLLLKTPYFSFKPSKVMSFFM